MAEGFKNALDNASFIDMIKGLDIILSRLKDAVGIPEGLLTPVNNNRSSQPLQH